ncbi:SAF domain-containing protein [Rhabdothermincola salaria]|uniref:SAF domain-containing protein n=1 Tax=Rhabdothermincola salaria TaxID=2903142 RepID=UPI001E40E3A3|nr:SAF domain-containing protein [Rhabdothermincola salaria]MCD9622370.1 hypothetical protein [Rhabdothermincola salaria]
MIGALLVTASALAVFTAYAGASTGPSGHAVKVTSSVPSGHVLTASDLAIVEIDLPEGTATGSFATVDDVVGSVTLTPLESDDLVQRSAVLAGDADRPPAHEFSFPIAPDRAVGGGLRAGETVDLFATHGSGPGAYTTVLARGAPVIGVQDAGRSALAGGGLVLTIALDTPDQVLEAAHAAQVAELTVVRSTGVTGVEGSRDRTESPTRAATPSGAVGDGGGR